MASVTKSVSGNTTTFTVTDAAGNAATLSVVSGAVTGNTVQFGGAAVLSDAQAIISNLVLELQTGLIPGAGAWGLNP